MGDLPDVRPTWADAIAAIRVGQQPLVDMIEYLVAERSELLADNERLHIAIDGCSCPAPYDSCAHDEPLTKAVGRLNDWVRKGDLEREQLRKRLSVRSGFTRKQIYRAVRGYLPTNDAGWNATEAVMAVLADTSQEAEP